MGILSFIRSKNRCRDSGMTRNDIIKVIEDFLQDTGEAWAWDDFTSSSKNHQSVEEVRLEILSIERANPALEQGWCSDSGLKKLDSLVERLKSEEW